MGKSKVQKGFLFYVFMFIAFAFGLVCIFGAILIFNPGKDVFGIGLTYVSFKGDYNQYSLTGAQEEVRLGSLSYNKIVFETQGADVTIDRDASAFEPYIRVERNVSAFSKEKETALTTFVTYENNTLTIGIKSPRLWLSLSNKLKITYFCAYDEDYTAKSVEFNTNSGDIFLGSQKPVNNDNRFKFNVKNLSISTTSGGVQIYDNVSSSNALNIITKKSKIYLYSTANTDGTAKLKDVNIQNDSGKIDIDYLAGNLSLDCMGPVEVSCGTILGDVLLDSTEGYFRANTLGKSGSNAGNFATFDAGALGTDIIIGTAYGDVSAQTKSGNVSVNKLHKKGLIGTESGNIKIGEALGALDLETTSGDITFKQTTTAQTNVISTKGNIYANYETLSSVYNPNTTHSVLSSQKANIYIHFIGNLKSEIHYEAQKDLVVDFDSQSHGSVGKYVLGELGTSSSYVIEATAFGGKIQISQTLQ